MTPPSSQIKIIYYSISLENVHFLLILITELKDLPSENEKPSEDDYEDLTDSDDLAEDMDALHVSRSLSSIKSDSASRLSLTKRKKSLLLHEKSNIRKKFWTNKLRGKLPISRRSHYASESKLTSGSVQDSSDLCVGTSYRAFGAEGGSPTLLSVGRAGVHDTMITHALPSTSGSNSITAQNESFEDAASASLNRAVAMSRFNAPLPFIANFNAMYPTNDIDDQLIRQRRFEMEFGILEKDGSESDDVWVRNSESTDSTESSHENEAKGQYPSYGAMGLLSNDPMACSDLGASLESNRFMCSTLSLNSNPWVVNVPRLQGVHTQVDYKHHLVPDMVKIVNSSFYWGVMDRYQAEKLIENKPEGTFLLRDSAQDEFLFSVSFRRYGRSLHARIEQWNHKFSFDSRDPGVFSADSVCGLIEHYKDPSCCMFFEPMLTLPLHRTFPFSLQHLTRATITRRVTYDGISKLPLPAALKEYLRFYHYKQKVRVRRFDNVA